MRNRLSFFLAVNTGFVSDGLPDKRFIQFYRSRSSPELYCSIVGNVVVPCGYGTNGGSAKIAAHPVWGNVAAAIAEGGTVPGIQLASVWKEYRGNRRFITNDSIQYIYEVIRYSRTLDQETIQKIISSFSTAAWMAIEHGFQHIQIHAAHGYLLSLLLDHRFNQEAAMVSDQLGELACQLNNSGIETSIRISLRTGDPEVDATDSTAFIDSICNLPFDFIDLSSGFYNINKRLIYPARPEIIEQRFRDTLAVASRHPTRSFIFSGRASEDKLSKMPPNVHLGLCRDLIANPRYMREPGNGCRNHNKCHYFSRGEPHLHCSRWDEPSRKSHADGRSA